MKKHKIIYEKWMAFAKKSSSVIAHVMLFLFFFLIFTPYTYIVRKYKKLLPMYVPNKNSYWVNKEKRDKESYYKQY